METDRAQTLRTYRVDAPHAAAERRPVFVDLDNALLKTSLEMEALLIEVRKNPWVLVPRTGSRRRQPPRSSRPVPRNLPLQPAVVDTIRSFREERRPIILVTRKHPHVAESIARETGLFDHVLITPSPAEPLREDLPPVSSEGSVIEADHHSQTIRDWCADHGYDAYAFLGRGSQDASRPLEVVESIRATAPAFQAQPATDSTTRAIPLETWTGRDLLQALRPVQWSKNALLLVPLVLAHRAVTLSQTIAVLIGMIAFSACASAVYVINDLLDVAADRKHPIKQSRPFAAGRLPLELGPYLALGLLLLAGLLACCMLPATFTAILLGYMVLTTAYSLRLKREVLLDVMILSMLYTLRIFAGGVASGVSVSPWLVAFSGFVFTSLAFVKRYSELLRIRDRGVNKIRGRGYRGEELNLVESLGTASACIAVLVLALYIQSDDMHVHYRSAWPLWAICPLVLYGLGRFWFLARRRVLKEDPVVFAVKDRVSLALALICAGLLCLAA